jgi:hypothetical protein
MPVWHKSQPGVVHYTAATNISTSNSSGLHVPRAREIGDIMRQAMQGPDRSIAKGPHCGNSPLLGPSKIARPENPPSRRQRGRVNVPIQMRAQQIALDGLSGTS